MKKLILTLLLVIFPFVCFAANIQWELEVDGQVVVSGNEPSEVTGINIYHQLDPGISGDQDLLDGIGFTQVSLPPTSRNYSSDGWGYSSGESFCVYLQAEVSDPDIQNIASDVVCGVESIRQVIRRTWINTTIE